MSDPTNAIKAELLSGHILKFTKVDDTTHLVEFYIVALAPNPVSRTMDAIMPAYIVGERTKLGETNGRSYNPAESSLFLRYMVVCGWSWRRVHTIVM